MSEEEERPPVDVELAQFNLLPQQRSNTAFMKVLATLFYYGNSKATAHELVHWIRVLDLLPLRGETPHGTIQGIISTARSTARKLKVPDPFDIYKEMGRKAYYSISEHVLNGATPPQEPQDMSIPEGVEVEIKHVNPRPSLASFSQDRPHRPKPKPKPKASYELPFNVNHRKKKRRKISKPASTTTVYRKSSTNGYASSVSELSSSMSGDEEDSDEEGQSNMPIQDDSIKLYDATSFKTMPRYIHGIQTTRYPTASSFAVAQQTGYSYPRFRSSDRIKIPKDECEDRFCVVDMFDQDVELNSEPEIEQPKPEEPEQQLSNIPQDSMMLDDSMIPLDGFAGVEIPAVSNPPSPSMNTAPVQRGPLRPKPKDIPSDVNVVGRLYCLADGHGGPGCSEYFVTHLPKEMQVIARKYYNQPLDEEAVQISLEREIKDLIRRMDDDYLAMKKQQWLHFLEQKRQGGSIDTVVNPVVDDGCTLIISLFLGDWLVHANVGDSRSIVMSGGVPQAKHADTITPAATETPSASDSEPPQNSTYDHTTNTTSYVAPTFVQPDPALYNFQVDFATQDHKPFLEHLAREILENGGEFVDSVQNRIIKIDPATLQEDGNSASSTPQAAINPKQKYKMKSKSRYALKNARIRPKDWSANQMAMAITNGAFVSQPVQPDEAKEMVKFENIEQPPLSNEDLFVPMTRRSPTPDGIEDPSKDNSNQLPNFNVRRRDSAPSLNVARSCGDMAFKLDPNHRIISCDADVTFIKIKDSAQEVSSTLHNGDGTMSDKAALPRRFLLMSSDGLFDHLYEELPEKQNRAVAHCVGRHLEEAEFILKPYWERDVRQALAVSAPNPVNLPTDEPEPAVAPQPDAVATINEEVEETVRLTLKERALKHAVRFLCDREGDRHFFSNIFQVYDDCTIFLIEI